MYFKSKVSDKIPYYKKHKYRKLNDLDKYLIFAFLNLILFTIISQIIFVLTQQEMTTLTTCFFAAFGGEVLMCALIKRLKLKKDFKEIKEDINDGS